MSDNYPYFYLITFFIPLFISLILTPAFRALALRYGRIDRPNEIKTHKTPTPLFGGAAIFAAFTATLLLLRLFTSFPTGTLHDLRTMLCGGTVIFLLGLADDIKKPKGLGVGTRFIIHFAVAFAVIYAGFRIQFLKPEHIAVIISALWIVGISNALNIIDIMDGLSSGQVVTASIGFLLIELPSESIYANFAAAALAGATLGFLPYNMSEKRKIFMGDSGSLFCGFILALMALGCHYSKNNPLGVYAPVFILAVPIIDTLFVSFLRMRRGMSPFRGSKDHFALRLEMTGMPRHRIVAAVTLFTLFMSVCAWLLTKLTLWPATALAAVLIAVILFILRKLAAIDINNPPAPNR